MKRSIFGIVALIVIAACGVSIWWYRGENFGKGASKIRFRYNEQNQLTKILGPGKRKTVLTYNERGQVYTMNNGDDTQVYEYTRLGLPQRITDKNGTTGLKYNAEGRLQTMSYPQGDSVTYEYNENGSVTSVAWGEKHYLRYTRDLLGNPIKIGTPAGDFTIQYDYTNRMMQRTYPNGAFSIFTFNHNGRPTRIRHVTPEKHLFLEFEYTYTDNGLLETVQEKSQKGELTITYTYDALGQLLKAIYSDGRVYTYTYDPFGNRINFSAPSGRKTAAYDEYDRLKTLNETQVQHDIAGNVIKIGDSKLTFNAGNQLIKNGNIEYTYDALGLRVKVSHGPASTRFLHFLDDLPYVLAETGNTPKRYIWGGDGQCLGQIEDKQTLLFFEDHLGSIRGAMDMAGKSVGTAEYSPFGVPVKRIAGVRFGFVGEDQDKEGRVYLRARYYAPEIGRFLSKDPILPQMMDEMKQNVYAYVNNSPLNYTDRNGANRELIASTMQRNNTNQIIQSVQQIGQQGITSLQQTGSAMKDYSLMALQKTIFPAAIGTLPHLVLNQNRAMQTALYLPNLFGAKPTIESNKNSGFIERGVKSTWCYNIPGASHIALWHDTILESFGRSDTPILESFGISVTPMTVRKNLNIPLMVPAAIGGIVHYYIDYAKGREYTANFTQNLLNVADIDMKTVHPFFVAPDFNRNSGPTAVRLPEPAQSSTYPHGFTQSSPSNYPMRPTMQRLPTPMTSPNVGGVYLNKAAEVIGDLGHIESVTFDPLCNRLLLVGTGSDSTTLSLREDDLAAVFRSVFGNYSDEPGVTIDPDPENPKAEQMLVRFFGGMENTHFGMVLLEADRQMKALSLGKDNITKEQVGVSVKGYHNMLELGFSNLGGKYNKNLWSRFWLIPEQILVKRSEDKQSITFPDTKIRIKTETMRWRKGKLIQAKGQKDEKAEYFAAHFTKHYDDYAKEFPVYQELKQLTNLVGLAKWIKDSGIQVNLDWLEQVDTFYETPKDTPSLSASEKREFTVGSSTISVFGGTDLTVENVYVNDDGTAARYGELAKQLVADHPGVVTTTFVDDKGETKRVIALPTSQTRAAGAKMLREDELRLFRRVYCSFHNDAGEFSHAWFLDLPQLKIIQPLRGQKKYVTVNKQQIPIQIFRLTRPFGMQNIFFEKHTVDQQHGTLAFLSERNDGIRALYPDPENKEYRVEYLDGRAEIFNEKGQILRQEMPNALTLVYAYDPSSGRITGASLMQEDIRIVKEELSYDDQGRIHSATVPSEPIRYHYDTNGDLHKVAGSNKTIEYTYNNLHLVTSVTVNGTLMATYEYDEFGRLFSQKEENGALLPRTINLVGGKTEIIEGKSDQQVVQIYDANGKLQEYSNASGDTATMTYYEAGRLKSVEYVNTFGDISRIDYASDNRTMKYTDPEKNVIIVMFDEFGRLKQVKDEKHVLANREYAMTSDGWLEQEETRNLKTQTIRNEQMLPVRETITSKTSSGNIVSFTHEYGKNSNLSRSTITGLFEGEYVYRNGKLKETTISGEKTSWSYDTKGLLSSVETGPESMKIKRNADGSVDTVSISRGTFSSNNRYKNGLLINRTNSAGLHDVFEYTEDGLLTGVKRGREEIWDIQRKDKKITLLRNDIAQLSYSFDEHGRPVEFEY